MGDAVTPSRKIPLTAIALALIAILVAGLFLAIAWQHANDRITANQHRSDQRWCTLLNQIDFPRDTAAGRKFTTALSELEREFGCHGA